MTYYVRGVIDKVDKVDIQAKNQGYQVKADNLRFCSGYQGYQGYQLFLADIQNKSSFTNPNHKMKESEVTQ